MKYDELLETTNVSSIHLDFKLVNFLFEEKWLYFRYTSFENYRVYASSLMDRHFIVRENAVLRFIVNLSTHARRIDQEMPIAYYIGPFSETLLNKTNRDRISLEIDGWSRPNPKTPPVDLLDYNNLSYHRKFLIVEWNPGCYVDNKHNEIREEFINFMQNSADRHSENLMIVIENGGE